MAARLWDPSEPHGRRRDPQDGVGPTAAASPAASSAASAAAGPAAVTIVNLSFQPASITVMTGTQITWTNNDSVGHTVTLDDNSVDSNTIDPGKTFQHAFSAAGSFTY